MRAIALALAFTTACDPPDCTTLRGTMLYGSKDCLGLQLAENRAILVMAPVVDVAIALDGLMVEIGNPPDEREGYIWCEGQDHVVLESADWTSNAYVHELVHAAEACASAGGDEHTRWKEAGWFEYIDAARLPLSP